jgi:hypothetical protein
MPLDKDQEQEIRQAAEDVDDEKSEAADDAKATQGLPGAAGHMRGAGRNRPPEYEDDWPVGAP